MSPTELLHWIEFVPQRQEDFKPSFSVDGKYLVIHLWGGNIYIQSDPHGSITGFIDDTSG
jgi:hypothetical protein